MPATRFSKKVNVRPPSGRKGTAETVIELAGLDMVNPIDMLKKGRSPYAKNFRLYAQQTDDRRVAISSRKGSGFYTNPKNESLTNDNSSNTDESFTGVGTITGMQMQSFVATSTSNLTRVSIRARKGTGIAPLLVTVYNDQNDMPYTAIAESSVNNLPEVADWNEARFINAPLLTSGEKYWIVLRTQDDGSGLYELATNSVGDESLVSNSTISSGTPSGYSLQYKVYQAPVSMDKNGYRFARDFGVNRTVVAYGTSMYTIDEATDNWVEVTNGLSALATDYSYDVADGKLFWANGFDDVRAWNGNLLSSATNTVSNPDFETNTTGWTSAGGTGNAISRVTTEHHSGVASLSVTATTGQRSATTNVAALKGQEFEISAWVKGTAGTTVDAFLVGPNATKASVAMDGTWKEIKVLASEQIPVTGLRFTSTTGNFYLDDVAYKSTGVEIIKDDQLPILSILAFHKDRLFGVSASDPNKLVFSENPGNPSDQPAGNQWYYNWLSVSFIYVPRPMNGSPITGIYSFQDSLTIFTQDNKYILSGFDRGSFSLRESTGNKGALSQRGIVADENQIWFVAEDGFYVFDGSKDTKISNEINPLFDGCGFKQNITPVVWNNHVRFYMAQRGSSVNNICVLYSKDFKEWLYDTDTWVNRAIVYNDADDNNELVELSSRVAMAYLGEQEYSTLGAPIDFEYRLKYDSMGGPAQRKKIKRFYPIFQGVDSTFPVGVSMDKNFEDSPKEKEQMLTTNGAAWGMFKWGDSTIYGGNKSFKTKRQSFSGYAQYWQTRIKRKAVNNRVAFIGIQFLYKAKRL